MAGKEYLGDGVYVEQRHGLIVLTTTEDDINGANRIYLEPKVYRALQAFVERKRKEGEL